MKNATAILPNTTNIRAGRRRARRSQRVIASNFRRAAHDVNTGPIELARVAHIRPHRMLLAWTGMHIMIPDMFRLMGALGMTTEDVFRGTGSVAR